MLLETCGLALLLFVGQGVYRNYGKTTYDAMPEHLNEKLEVENAFPDDSQYSGLFGRLWKRLMKTTKPWEAFGPRSNYWWARWRSTPLTIFAIHGKGPFRLERDGHPDAALDEAPGRFRTLWMAGSNTENAYYFSRVQYWTRWHFAVQWPFQITFHAYWRAKDVPNYPDRPRDLTIKDVFFVYGPIHRDADKVYWIGSFFIGGGWK